MFKLISLATFSSYRRSHGNLSQLRVGNLLKLPHGADAQLRMTKLFKLGSPWGPRSSETNLFKMSPGYSLSKLFMMVLNRTYVRLS